MQKEYRISFNVYQDFTKKGGYAIFSGYQTATQQFGAENDEDFLRTVAKDEITHNTIWDHKHDNSHVGAVTCDRKEREDLKVKVTDALNNSRFRS
jgi:hypothetical protein